jgi:hypothetical protein
LWTATVAGDADRRVTVRQPDKVDDSTVELDSKRRAAAVTWGGAILALLGFLIAMNVIRLGSHGERASASARRYWSWLIIAAVWTRTSWARARATLERPLVPHPAVLLYIFRPLGPALTIIRRRTARTQG